METQIPPVIAIGLLTLISLGFTLVSLVLIRMILKIYKDTVYEWRRQ